MNAKKDPVIKVVGLAKVYREAKVSTLALQNVSFSLQPGSFTVITGPSGAGKTTLLNLLGGMDEASAGSIKIQGREIVGLPEKDLYGYRREKVGLVFQFYNLMPSLTALENVELVTDLKDGGGNALEALRLVGLEKRQKNLPKQLSGGEQQRVCIARAIAKEPTFLLCDEPTGALDYETGKGILELLVEMAHDEGKTVVIVTHNSVLTKAADHVIELRDGHIIKDYENKNPASVEELYW